MEFRSFMGERIKAAKTSSPKDGILWFVLIPKLNSQCRRLKGEQSAFCSSSNQAYRFAHCKQNHENVGDLFKFSVSILQISKKMGIVCAL